MFGFNFVEPIEVTDAVLTATNVVEATAAWTAGTYAEGALRAHVGRIWQSLVDTNTATPGTDATKWFDTGATNTRRMFDEAIQSQSVQADEIAVELTMPAGSRADTLYVQNVEAVTATVVVTDPAEPGFSYTEVQTLVDNSGVTNIWRYLFLPLRRRTYALFSNQPNYAGLKFALTLASPGADAKCGDCVIGRATQFGVTQFGGEVGMIDFSIKSRDAFGRISWVERSWADTVSVNVWVLKGDLDMVTRKLREARASRRLYIAYDGHAATIVNGVWTDWRIRLETPTHYLLTIPLESLA
jgi:hypothetical protein